MPNVETHSGVPGYAIPSRFEIPNLKKWPKTSFFALSCIIYAHYASIINHARPMTYTTHVMKHLGLPSESETPNLRKLTKTSFLALFCTINAH